MGLPRDSWGTSTAAPQRATVSFAAERKNGLFIENLPGRRNDEGRGIGPLNACAREVAHLKLGGIFK